jgi:leader peptidase (prepilin peptidase)/N-methyltransferase
VTELTNGLALPLAGLLGLLVGSFLNVVVHRLPLMLERRWQEDCAAAGDSALEGEPAGISQAEVQPPFNLSTPRSRCPHCGHQIRWYENIPLLSWIFLRARCSACHAGISIRYPAVELFNALLFVYCAWRWGFFALETWAWGGFSAALLCLTLIDWDTTLLPDDITLPLLWAGLLCAVAGLTGVTAANAVIGAGAGYLSLWLVYWAFRLVTGKEGMGYGDFKLFAALGAWLSWQALIPVILCASVVGAVVGLALKFTKGLREGGYVPFGPFLALGGILTMMLGTDWINRLLGLPV